MRGEAVVEHRDDLSPEATAERLLNLGGEVDAIAAVTADHPRITEAMDRLRADGVPVVAVISDVTAPSRAGCVGLDNWKVGATAAWAMAKLCKRPGKIAVFVGNHRYLCQDMCEIRFRSYFRERATYLTPSRLLRTASTRIRACSISCIAPPIWWGSLSPEAGRPASRADCVRRTPALRSPSTRSAWTLRPKRGLASSTESLTSFCRIRSSDSPKKPSMCSLPSPRANRAASRFKDCCRSISTPRKIFDALEIST